MLTGALSRFCADLRYDDLPADIVTLAKHYILDTLGVALLGSADASTHMVSDAAGAATTPGDCTIVGTATRTLPAIAALVNGYAAHAMDYDDAQHDCATHISAPVLPAALAAAEMQHRSGRDLIVAYVVGFEIGCRLGRAAYFGGHLHRQGIHPTSYLGHFGAAAAAASLMGFDAAAMNRCLGVVSGQAGGLLRSFGTMAKPLNAAHAAQDAMLAAALTARGFTAPDNVFDGKGNVFTLSGGETDVAQLTAELGSRFEISRNTVKVYACTAWRNPVVEGMIEMATRHALDASNVAAVTVWACTDVLRLPDYPEPRTGLEGKFSTAHAVSVAIVDRAGNVAQFTDARVNDAMLESLRKKVTVVEDAEMPAFHIRLRVMTTDGRTLDHAVTAQKGGPKNPLTWDEMAAKFTGNAETVLPASRVAQLVDRIGRLEAEPDVADLLALCRPA